MKFYINFQWSLRRSSERCGCPPRELLEKALRRILCVDGPAPRLVDVHTPFSPFDMAEAGHELKRDLDAGALSYAWGGKDVPLINKAETVGNAFGAASSTAPSSKL